MANTVVQKSEHAPKRNAHMSGFTNPSLMSQLLAEKETYELWLKDELKYEAYSDLLLGIAAFAITGKLITESELAGVFPPDELGIEGLKSFIWDVTRNDCRVTIRIREQLG